MEFMMSQNATQGSGTKVVEGSDDGGINWHVLDKQNSQLFEKRFQRKIFEVDTSKQKVKRGLWSPEEDEKLMMYITTHGHGCWSSVPKLAGLQRCGKSCRLRWINYLRPDLKRGSFSANEERIIIDVHRILGNRWAQISKHLPGRTDNEVKNFWNSCIKKKLIAQGLDPKTHNLMPAASRAASSNNNVTNISQFHQSQSSTTIPFTISPSNIKSFDASKTSSVDHIISPPFVTLPQSSLHDSTTIANSTFQYQDPNVLMSFKDQDPHNLMEYTNCSSSSLEHANISPSFNHSEFMDEACMWGSNGTVEGMEAPKGNGLVQGHAQAQEGHEMNEEMSYNSSTFDLELMDSALMPCGMFSSGSSMEQLQWDC